MILMILMKRLMTKNRLKLNIMIVFYIIGDSMADKQKMVIVLKKFKI